MWCERIYTEHGHTQLHQACAYGSLRPQWTRLTANFPDVWSINGVCPGSHRHAAWGLVWHGNKRRFVTALEVHYPANLHTASCEAFVMQVVKRGIRPQLLCLQMPLLCLQMLQLRFSPALPPPLQRWKRWFRNTSLLSQQFLMKTIP